MTTTNKYYAGIGSRETPQDVLSLMTKIGTYLELQGYTLRSGGCTGADTAFAQGCTKKEIFIPWEGYEGFHLKYFIPDQAFELAAKLHPGWVNLSGGARALMARNCMQVLGPNLNSPSDFVICWTRDGIIHESERTSKSGGTGQAISLASRNNIPVFNLKREDHLARFKFLL